MQLLNANQYSLILATALFSITVNPFMYKLLPFLERSLRKAPGFWKKLESHVPIPEIQEDELSGHVVIIGYGRVGKQLVDVLESLTIPLLVIEADAERIASLNQRHIPTLYGDAANSEVIRHANLQHAHALVSTVPDETAAMLSIVAAKDLNPHLPVIARAATEAGVRHLAEAVRRDHYNFDITTDEEHHSLHDLLLAFKGIEIRWIELKDDSPLIGKTLAEADIRSQTGALVIALMRNGRLTANPKSMTIFKAGDRIGFLGEKEQIESLQALVG